MKSFIVSLLMVISLSLAAQPVYNVALYGAKGDGKSNEIEALRKVADLICQNGGGTVVFEKGKQGYVKRISTI